MTMFVKHEELALVQGWDDTKVALREWRARPSMIIVPWVRWSFGVTVLLLLSTWIVSVLVTPDQTRLHFPGVTYTADVVDYGHVLFRNSLVLALHALACVAGFIAGSSLPQIAPGYSGLYRRVHELARPLAIGFVVAATVFSLATQAYVLGGDASTMAFQWDISTAGLLGMMSLHAIPELIALFLPLAAWTMASRAREWENLLAATFATLAVSIPMILVSAAIEVWITPRLILSLI